MQPFLDSTDLAADPDALNERLAAEGYLFVRALLPRAAVLDVRRECRAVAAAGGWLDSAHPVDDGVANPAAACTDPEPRYVEVFRRLYVLEALHALKHHPAIVGFFERLFGEPVLVHPLFVMRNIFPQRPPPTRTTCTSRAPPRRTRCGSPWATVRSSRGASRWPPARTGTACGSSG